MAQPSKRAIVRAVLARYPESYAERLRIEVAKNTPAPLYQWLIVSLLFSARIRADHAAGAAQALFKRGWRTPKKMSQSIWAERVKELNRSGYARYDESTSRYIGETTEMMLRRYGGDLRRLRAAAQHEPARERELLKQFKGIGEIGADIFFREVQIAWDELYPFADRKALDAARKLGLGSEAAALARLSQRQTLPRLLTGLVRVELADEADAVLRSAA